VDTTEQASAGFDISRKAKVRIILESLARMFFGLAFVFVMMRLVPVNPHLNLWIPITMGIVMLLAFAWYFRLQLRRIHRAQFPRIQATEALLLLVAMFLAFFSVTYYAMSLAEPVSFSENLDQFSAFYFTVTVLATVGFGDITPVTIPARSVAMVQMGFDIAFIAVAVRIVSGTANQALKSRSEQSNGD
jgi:voltage-gated potassium channel